MPLHQIKISMHYNTYLLLSHINHVYQKLPSSPLKTGAAPYHY